MYSDCNTLVKAGTQSATFVRTLFRILTPNIETFSTFGTAPSLLSIPTNIPPYKIGQLKLQLIQCFVYLLFKPLKQDSDNAFEVGGSTYFWCVLMFVTDRLEERTLPSLRRRDSDMDGTHFVLRTRLREVQLLMLSSRSAELRTTTCPRRQTELGFRVTISCLGLIHDVYQ